MGADRGRRHRRRSGGRGQGRGGLRRSASRCATTKAGPP